MEAGRLLRQVARDSQRAGQIRGGGGTNVYQSDGESNDLRCKTSISRRASIAQPRRQCRLPANVRSSSAETISTSMVKWARRGGLNLDQSLSIR